MRVHAGLSDISSRTGKMLLASLFALSALAGPFFLSGYAAAAACEPIGKDHGTVSTTVNIPETATYYIWSRMKASGDFDTFFLEIDGNDCIWVGGPQDSNKWNWINFKDHNPDKRISKHMTKGNHSLKIIGNDENVLLDRIAFVSDANCKPTSKTGEECDIPADKKAPSVEITSPAPNSKIKGIQKVKANASDNVGVARVEFFTNSSRRGVDSNSPYEFDLNTTDLQDNEYLLIVKAYDGAGNVSSDSIKVTVDNSGLSAPPPPKKVDSTPKGNGVEVTWEKSEGASGYQIFRDGVPIAQVGPNATNYLDKDVIPNTDYDYQVSALNESGFESDPSEKANTKTTKVDDSDAPSEVNDLGVKTVSSGQINLKWKPSVDNIAVKYYDVYRSTNGGDMQRIAQVSSVSFGDVGLDPNTEYTYQVRARDSNDNVGAPSENVKAKTGSAQRKGVVYGAVKDKATGKALVGGTVVVNGREGKKYIYTTSRNGEYIVRRLEAGNYNVSFRNDGYKSITSSFRSNDNITRKDANLEKR